MPNYFSRLAEQSGFQFKGSQGVRPEVLEKKAGSGLSPLEQEATILSPSQPLEKSSLTLIDSNKHEMQPSISKNEEIKNEPSEKAPINPKEIFAQKQVTREVNPIVQNIDSVTAPMENKTLAASLFNKAILPVNKMNENSLSQESKEFKSPSAVKLADPVEASVPIQDSPQFESAEKQESIVSLLSPLENSEKPNYFSRTSEILNQGQIEKQDIHSLILQDVQEWVAASPTDTKTVKSNIEVFNTALNSEPVFSNEITDPLTQNLFRSRNAEVESSLEHNFNLSIGSISIIIDEPTKPQHSEFKSQPQPQPTIPKNENRFSRLSRSYL